MAQINLTEEEKLQIIDALNQGLEPSPELLPKVFPRTAEKFDVVALDRAKIPTLEYAGKRTKAAILAEGSAGIGAAPIQTVRCFGDAKEDEWKNLIVQGDNLQFLKTCYKNTDPLIKDKVKGKVKLIYIDPPFATKSDFGGKDGEYSYADKVDRARFLETLRERLIYLREILASDSSIYVHLDQKMSHYVKIVMDEVFGKDNYKNEIVWHYDTGGIPDTFYAQKHDSLLFYAFGKYHFDASGLGITRRDQCEKCSQQLNKPNNMKKGVDVDGRVYRSIMSNGKEYRYYDDEIITPTDVWININQLQQKDPERVSNSNYPTIKPEKLLQRIVRASTEEGDLVMDCFAGSGVTLAVAEKLGRRWIGCDFGKHSIYTIQKRILNVANSKKLSKENKLQDKYGIDPKPFCVLSTGAYDFSHVMDLRNNKDTYVDFVLGLFQLVRDEEKATHFRLPNIYGLKENNPVEIYPVWDDHYLKEIRIDETYLQSIVDHAGGRLRGDYYIITPESCANVGETTLKNQEGKDVTFKLLTFPYKILEDISQKLKLEDQPSSAKDINNLVTSTSFYFNDNLEIEMERIDKGLKITKFDSKILDSSGNRFEGLSGLAMLLVDLNYEPGKPFDMDVAIYAEELSEDGTCKIDNLTPIVGVIAIDKHGNESKPYQVK